MLFVFFSQKVVYIFLLPFFFMFGVQKKLWENLNLSLTVITWPSYHVVFDLSFWVQALSESCFSSFNVKLRGNNCLVHTRMGENKPFKYKFNVKCCFSRRSQQTSTFRTAHAGQWLLQDTVLNDDTIANDADIVVLLWERFQRERFLKQEPRSLFNTNYRAFGSEHCWNTILTDSEISSSIISSLFISKCCCFLNNPNFPGSDLSHMAVSFLYLLYR